MFWRRNWSVIIMKKELLPVFWATCYLVFYVFVVHTPGMEWFAWAMFLLSPLIVISMVLQVLKTPCDSDRTFEEYFYEDVDIKRNVVKK